MTLMQAAARLSLSYHQTLRLVLIRQLKGAQAANGAWRVDTDDLERFAQARAARPKRRRAAYARVDLDAHTDRQETRAEMLERMAAELEAGE